MNKTDCLFCEGKIIYDSDYFTYVCLFCGGEFEANVHCENGHYICDKCHSKSGNDFIEQYCLRTQLTNPIEIAQKILLHEGIFLHGPEHHFLPAAVLLTSCSKVTNRESELVNMLKTAKKRAGVVVGGMCGFYGSCGAAISAGIFLSVFFNITPYSVKEWGLANELTGRCLKEVAKSGGPRCCKRATFRVIVETIKFLEEKMNINLNHPESIECNFYSLNKECIENKCEFFRIKNKIDNNDITGEIKCCC